MAPALLLALSCSHSRALAGLEITGGCKKQKIDEQKSPGYEDNFRKQLEAQLGSNGKVKWTSCYRSAQEQLTTCRKVCPGGKDSCPGTCAPAGQSKHQRVATADVGGLPGDVKKGCDFLYEVCQKMRQQNNSLSCEIGGYGSGGHHLAVGTGFRSTAYNKCSYLKSKMGADPGNLKGLEKESDEFYESQMGSSPNGSPGPSEASSPQGASGGSGAPGSGDASTLTGATPSLGIPSATPSPPGGEGWRDSATGATSPTPKRNPSAVGSSAGRREDDTYQGRGTHNPPLLSHITSQGTDDPAVGGPRDTGPAVGMAAGAGADPGATMGLGTRAPSGAKLDPQLSSANGTGDLSSSPTAAGAGKEKDSDANQILAPFGSGSGSRGGAGGKPMQGMTGVDNYEAVKNIMSDFSRDMESPAAESEERPAALEGVSLFARCHAAYMRCARSGCVTEK